MDGEVNSDAAILALIADLYAQTARMQAQVASLQQQLAEAKKPPNDAA